MKTENLLPHLATRIYNVPLMITPDKLEVIVGVLNQRIGLDLPERKAAVPDPREAVSDQENVPVNIAVIPVHGTLVHRTPVDAFSGMRTYGDMLADFRAAMDARDIDAILLDIDSPGGEVSGVFALSDEIYESRGQKPIYAYVNEAAFSAAYAIASAADRIFLPRTGGVGSIGVIAVHTDQSGWNEKNGVKFTSIFAGKHKNDFSPHSPLSGQAHQIAQDSVNGIYEIFVETVARNRGISAETVRKTEAGIYDGAKAVSAGLADEVLSLNQAIERIANNGGGESMLGSKQSFKQKVLAASSKASEDEVVEAFAELGYVPVNAQAENVDLDAVKAEAKEKVLAEYKAYVEEVMSLCSIAGLSKEAASLIESEASIDDVKKQLVNAKADATGSDEIISTVSATSVGEPNPMVAEARKRADAQKK